MNGAIWAKMASFAQWLIWAVACTTIYHYERILGERASGFVSRVGSNSIRILGESLHQPSIQEDSGLASGILNTTVKLMNSNYMNSYET